MISPFLHDRNKGFDIKWVDDTHAIGIFASNIAGEWEFLYDAVCLEMFVAQNYCQSRLIKLSHLLIFAVSVKPSLYSY